MIMKVEQTGKYISVLYRLIVSHMAKALKKYNIRITDYIYLMILSDGVSRTQEELTRVALVDKAQTTRAIQSLLSMELIKKTCNPNDKRSFMISLSSKGNELAPKVFEDIMIMEQKLNKGFNKEKQRQMKRDMIHMIKNMNQ